MTQNTGTVTNVTPSTVLAAPLIPTVATDDVLAYGKREQLAASGGAGVAPQGVDGAATKGSPEASRLGNYRKQLFTPPENIEFSRRVLNRRITAMHRQFKPGTRWAKCGTPLASRTSVKRASSGGVSMTGLESCSSATACFRCSSKIMTRRADEVTQAVRKVLGDGGSAFFVTLTLSHSHGEDLAAVWDDLRDSWSAFASGGAYSKWRKDNNIIGVIKASEVTYSEAAGFHPHLHAIFLVSRPVESYGHEFGELARWVHDRWKTQATRSTGRNVSLYKGAKVVPVTDDSETLGQYLSKVAYELCLTQNKRGRGESRSVYQIGADAVQWGDKKDVSLWLAWCDSAKGRKMITWTPGLKALLGVGDQSDSDIVEEEQEGKVEGHVGAKLWRRVRNDGLEALFLDQWETQSSTLAVSTLIGLIPGSSHFFDRDGLLCVGMNEELAVMAGLP